MKTFNKNTNKKFNGGFNKRPNNSFKRTNTRTNGSRKPAGKIDINRLSMFFSANDVNTLHDDYIKSVITNGKTCGEIKSYNGDFRYDRKALNNILLTASRMDMIAYMLNKPLEIVRWYINPKVADMLNLHKNDHARTATSVLFRVGNYVETKTVFGHLKRKLIESAVSDKVSVDELFFDETLGAILISFNNKIESERNRIGYLTKKKDGHKGLFLTYENKKPYVHNKAKGDINGEIKK